MCSAMRADVTSASRCGGQQTLTDCEGGPCLDRYVSGALIPSEDGTEHNGCSRWHDA